MCRLSASMFDEYFLRGVAQQVHLSCSDEGTLHVFYEGLVSWGGFFLVTFFSCWKKVTRQLAKPVQKKRDKSK